MQSTCGNQELLIFCLLAPVNVVDANLIHESAITPGQAAEVHKLRKCSCLKKAKILTLWLDLQASPTTNDRIVGVLSLFDNLLIFLSFSLLRIIATPAPSLSTF